LIRLRERDGCIPIQAPPSSAGRDPLMGEVVLPLTVIFASVTVASAIIYAARTIASAIARQPPNVPANDFLSSSPDEAPRSLASLPVEPSGVPVEIETHLEVGSIVLAFSHGRWWRAEVTALEGEDHVRIRYPGWGPIWDASMQRSALQVDLGGAAEVEPPYGDE
jgi:hypothetical protein